MLLAIFSKSYNFYSHQLNSRNTGPVLLFLLYLDINTVPVVKGWQGWTWIET